MIAMLGTLISSLFQRPATVRYPLVPREPAPEARGHIEIDIGKCIFCGICRRKCPTEAIEVDRAGKAWAIERFKCMQCGSCVENCPKSCLLMDAHPSPVATGMIKDVVHARVSSDA